MGIAKESLLWFRPGVFCAPMGTGRVGPGGITAGIGDGIHGENKAEPFGLKAGVALQ